MTFSDTVAPAVDLLDGLGPWGVLVGALVALVGPRLVPLVAKLGPAAAAAYAVVLALFARKTPATPTPAVPAADPTPAAKHPLLADALTILKMAALARFSWLSPDDALVRYAQEHVSAISPAALADFAHQNEPPFVTPAVVTPAPAAVKDFPVTAAS